MSAVRVLLVDDQELMRQGLRKLLEIEDVVEVVGEAADGVEALEVIARTCPDVALVDALMPRMDGVELITRLAAEHPSVAAVVLITTAGSGAPAKREPEGELCEAETVAA